MVVANIAGRPLTNPMFTAIWDQIDAAALPVLVHPFTRPGTQDMALSSHDLTWNTGHHDGGGALLWLIGRLDRGWELATLDDQKALSACLPRIACDSVT